MQVFGTRNFQNTADQSKRTILITCVQVFLHVKFTSDMTLSPRNDVAVLDKIFNFLVRWSVRIVCVKNYQTV